MKKQLAILASVSTLALLAACGGGGDDATTTTTTTTTATAATDKYVGTWAFCETDNEREVVTIQKVSATQFTFAFDVKQYPSANCTGTPTQQEAGSATVTIAADTITVDGQTTDKLDAVVNSITNCTDTDCAAPGETFKWIGRATSTQMFIGFDQPSADTYPTAFDTTYTKQ